MWIPIEKSYLIAIISHWQQTLNPSSILASLILTIIPTFQLTLSENSIDQSFLKKIIGHININSIKNKFEILKSMLSEVLDVLMITETKLNDSFPEQQFHIEGFNIPFRLDRNRHGEGLLLHVRNNNNAVFLKSYVFPDNIVAFFIEILRKSCKWLICFHIILLVLMLLKYIKIGKALDTYSRKYENTLLIGDLNVESNEANLKTFCNQYKLRSLNKESTCFKTINKPSCIDLFLTKNSKCFEDCLTLETGLSDFHKLIVTLSSKSPKL